MNLLVILFYVRKYNGKKQREFCVLLIIKSVPILSMSSFELLMSSAVPGHSWGSLIYAG
jgi:hypothetical protein